MFAIANRLFVVAAHPDDDVIGCGGTMSLVSRSGGIVSVAYLTDGSRSHPWCRSYTPEGIRDVREIEAVEALAELGVTTKPEFFRLPDSGLATLAPAARDDARRRLADSIAAFSPDLIVAPWKRDPHADHIVAGELALEAARLAGYRGDFAGYEVWLPIRGGAGDLPRPEEVRGVRIALDASVMAMKRRAIMAHRSQTTDLIDGAGGFRIDDAMLARWVTPVEPLLYERFEDRGAGCGAVLA